MNEEGFSGFLERLNCLTLPSEGVFRWDHCQGDFAHETREGEFEKEEVGCSLVLADFA